MKLENSVAILIALFVCCDLGAQPRYHSASVRDGKIEYEDRGPIRELSFQGFCAFDSLSERKQKRLSRVTSLSWSNVVAPVLPDYVPLDQIRNAELNEVVDDWCPLSYMPLAPFPQQVLQMHALERFSEMNVVFIPENIVQLRNLRYVEFESRGYDQMQFLPLCIGLLPELDTFSLNYDYSGTAELLFYRICNKDLKIVSRDIFKAPGEQYREYELPEIYYDSLLYSLAHHLMIYFDKGHTKLMMDGHFKNGTPDGDWMIYHGNGKVKEERHYSNGIAIGTWKSYRRGDDKLTQQIVFSESGYVLHNYAGYSEEQVLTVSNNLQAEYTNYFFYTTGDLRGSNVTTFDSTGRIATYTHRDLNQIYEHQVFRNNYLLAQDVQGECDCPEPKPDLPMRVIFDQTGHWYKLECTCGEK